MASPAKPSSEYALRKSAYLRKCEPIKDKALCETLPIGKVQEYAQACGVDINDQTKHRKKKDILCQDLATHYAKESQKELASEQDLRKDLNRVYFNLYFVDKAAKAGLIRKFFFGKEIEALDQKKKDFINTMIGLYNDLDQAVEAENSYVLIDAVYYYGLAIQKMMFLVIANHEIKVEKAYRKARDDLTEQLKTMIHDYTVKLTTLTSLLKEGGKAEQYLRYLAEKDFDIKDLHEFTIYGEDRYAKVVNIHDGDTASLVLQVDNHFYKWNCRAYGYDAYEIHSKNPEKKARAEKAKEALNELIMGKVIVIRAMPASDKYGRVLANIYMFHKDMPPNFDFHPRYKELVTGLDEGGASSSKSATKVEHIPISSFKDILRNYYRPDRPDLIYINQLMIDLGLGIPYEGGKKIL